MQFLQAVSAIEGRVKKDKFSIEKGIAVIQARGRICRIDQMR